MNNFFKQLLGSIVQIGMQELNRKQVSGVRYQRTPVRIQPTANSQQVEALSAKREVRPLGEGAVTK